MPLETHLHHDALWSMVVVFGVDLLLPLLLALVFVLAGLRRDGDDRRAFLGLARWSVIVAVFLQLLSVGYHARLIAGTAERGTVTAREEVLGGKSPHCALTLDTAHGSLDLSVPQGHCNDLSPGTSVPLLTVASSTTFAQVGERPTASALLTFGLLPLLVLMVAGLVVRGTSR